MNVLRGLLPADHTSAQAFRMIFQQDAGSTLESAAVCQRVVTKLSRARC